MSIKKEKGLDPETLRAQRQARIEARKAKKSKSEDDEKPWEDGDDDDDADDDDDDDAESKKKAKAKKGKASEDDDGDDKDDDKGDDNDDADEDEESEGKKKKAAKEKVESAFNYNPLLKPTHLGGDSAPRGGYHYFGPPPDAGTSYGLFSLASGNGVIAPIEGEAKAIHDPETGKSVEMKAEADKDAVTTLLAARDELTTLPPCPSCKQSRLTSAAVITKGFKSIHCTACGGDLTEKVHAMKAELDKGASTTEAEPTTTEATTEEATAQFEVLSSIDAFDTVVEADVNMTLFNEDESNPFWNIDIQGMPVARVYLQDQPKPEETRAVFTSEQYFNGVSGGIAKLGVKEVLSKINARPWANVLDESEKVKDLKDQVRAEFKEAYDEQVGGFRDKLLQCVAIVCAGMDKNFWREDGNPLKEELYATFRKLGIPGNSITAAIEEAFSKGSTRYFESVLNKGINLMEKDDAVIAQLADTIGEANVLQPEAPSAEGSDLPVAEAGATGGFDPTTASTLNDRLKQSSMALSSYAGSSHGSEGYSSLKDSFKSNLRLGGASPRNK